jgi:hypothetical protein
LAVGTGSATGRSDDAAAPKRPLGMPRIRPDRVVHSLRAIDLIAGRPIVGKPEAFEIFDEVAIDNDLLLLAA